MTISRFGKIWITDDKADTSDISLKRSAATRNASSSA